MTRIEMDYMNAVIMMNRKLKDSKEIDWEQRRYELAKEAMQGYITSQDFKYDSNETLVKWSVSVADALIKELQGGKQYG